jgi:ATP-dependent DNA helicase PIF1
MKATSLCHFTKNSKETILQSVVIIWDEAPMLNRWGFEAVDRSLRLLMNNDKPFGGKIMVLGGDLRQVLPVIPKAKKSQIMSMILKRSD